MPIPQKASFLIILLSLVLGVVALHPAVVLAQQAGERVLARNLTDAKFAEIRRRPGCFTAPFVATNNDKLLPPEEMEGGKRDVDNKSAR